MKPDQNTQDQFDEWCILELMGGRRLAGKVTEATVAGGAFLRIDVFGEDKDAPALATQFYSPSSVYAMTPTTEAVCRRFAEARGASEPVSKWDLELPVQQRIEAPRGTHYDEDGPQDEDDE